MTAVPDHEESKVGVAVPVSAAAQGTQSKLLTREVTSFDRHRESAKLLSWRCTMLNEQPGRSDEKLQYVAV